MGYSEVHCRLCDVVFNISRIRKPDEPESHAWMNTGDGNMRYVPAEERWDSSCTSEDACYGVWRGKDPPDLRRSGKWRAIAIDEDNENDSDYVYASSDGDEEYEFQSDDDLVDHESEVAEGMEDDVEMTDADSEPEYIRFLKSNSGLAYEYDNPRLRIDPNLMAAEKLPVEERLGLVIKLETKLDDKEAQEYEHIAGPTCTCERGYNGHNIAAEEMRGCNTFQCFVRKSRGWRPEGDDQDFEAASTHFLSGLCGHMPSTDSGGYPQVIPARHGVEEVDATDHIWGNGEECMPFHTTCLDIFMRMSKQAFGEFDVDDLCAWYRAGPKYPWTDRSIEDKDRRACQNQWWIHADGTEYLAANPVFMPRLSQILRSVVSDGPNFDSQAGAFTGLVSTPSRIQDDPFNNLPLELRLEILGYLSPKDIASLRLSSRNFYQMPIFLWREFVQRDMPWLWEIWSDQKPYIWSTVPVEALKKEEADKQVFYEEFACYKRVIREEMPELLDMWQGAEESIMEGREAALIAQCEAEALKDLVWTIPAERINWYQLYSEITRNWRSLKGLQNRRRIWNYEGDIIDWIRKIRKHRGSKQLQIMMLRAGG
ncbi:hypothetical protein BU16DRAFT_316138 [Lophium mytilinum]|uniref:F-box domain-containing protein n=1 Tax=Lophium mytilinum TaxID=390894 RepID=A0A6A6QYJ6_9PEZI|nr:hypothetical protein BU16DRAFT_316138 [Lophium mytilinum]